MPVMWAQSVTMRLVGLEAHRNAIGAAI